MKFNRGQFLKLTALSAAFGLGGKKAISLIAGNELRAAPGTSSAPAADPKKRWGMTIEMGKCKEGCNECITACHTTHNVPDHGNPKDEVKWIWKEKKSKIFGEQVHPYAEKNGDKPFLYMCLQCDEPPCTRVCPVNATFPREDGIVMMDFHRCIGCRFCMAACPYGCRSFNFRDPRPAIKELDTSYPTRSMGVVEKCNFCNERVDKGNLPACVETCPEKVLTFGDLNDENSEIREILRTRETIQPKTELGTKPSVFYIV